MQSTSLDGWMIYAKSKLFAEPGVIRHSSLVPSKKAL
jgi:hypothetical protein